VVPDELCIAVFAGFAGTPGNLIVAVEVASRKMNAHCQSGLLDGQQHTCRLFSSSRLLHWVKRLAVLVVMKPARACRHARRFTAPAAAPAALELRQTPATHLLSWSVSESRRRRPHSRHAWSCTRSSPASTHNQTTGAGQGRRARRTLVHVRPLLLFRRAQY
jgi:hypothetical protein